MPKMKTGLAFAAAILTVAPRYALAENERLLETYSAALDRCAEEADRAAMARGLEGAGMLPASKCAVSIVRRMDALLNAKYKALMQSEDVKNRVLIVNSERQWIVDRDRNCGIEAGEKTMVEAQAQCVADEIADRIMWIGTYRHVA